MKSPEQLAEEIVNKSISWVLTPKARMNWIAKELRNARAEAFEEAAKIAEEHPLSWYDPNTIHRDIATQIRAAARAEREGE